MLALDHVGIAVRHLSDAARVYETLLGLTITERYELPAEGVRIAFVRSGAVDLEFLEPVGEGGPLATFLATRGPGLHHVAFRVPDLKAALAAAVAGGATPVEPSPRVPAVSSPSRSTARCSPPSRRPSGRAPMYRPSSTMR